MDRQAIILVCPIRKAGAENAWEKIRTPVMMQSFIRWYQSWYDLKFYFEFICFFQKISFKRKLQFLMRLIIPISYFFHLFSDIKEVSLSSFQWINIVVQMQNKMQLEKVAGFSCNLNFSHIVYTVTGVKFTENNWTLEFMQIEFMFQISSSALWILISKPSRNEAV